MCVISTVTDYERTEWDYLSNVFILIIFTFGRVPLINWHPASFYILWMRWYICDDWLAECDSQTIYVSISNLLHI